MKDRIVIVTGAADGIGAATAQAFADAGATVIGVDIQSGCDVTDEGAVGEMVGGVVRDHGRIDALANVVGGSKPGKTILDLTLGEWEDMLRFNLTSTFLVSRAVIPHMAPGSTIVNVSSGAGLRGMKANPGYVAAKAGVAALTRAMAVDHAAAGIRVNAVAPGPIRTPLMERNRTPDEIAAMGRIALVGRIGEPREIADVIVWLSSEASSYVVGQTIEVDGGPSAPV